MTSRRIFFGVVIALALLVAACGDSSGSATPSSAAFNDADVSFAQGMIPHHTQAVEMADLGSTQASSAKVKDLAVRIKAAQGPEITAMTAWLKSWNKPVEASGGDMSGMDMGIMSAADMKSLTAATGTAFDKMFLTMMVVHHKGAIEMANTEQNTGKFADAKAMAGAIITGQQAEIDEMTKLLASAG
jgi:uncharacterized protein (DUF305 family)